MKKILVLGAGLVSKPGVQYLLKYGFKRDGRLTDD
jgi:saccharopine dehydrogenase-like NADP-dependent oxidoreductase